MAEDVKDLFKKEVTDEMLKSADEYVEARILRERLEKQAEEAKEKEDQLQEELVTQMIAKGIKNIKRDDGITLIQTKKHAYYVKTGEKEKLLAMFKERGDGGMIKEDVPWQTLQSFFSGLSEKIAERSVAETVVDSFNAYMTCVDHSEKNGLQARGIKNKI